MGAGSERLRQVDPEALVGAAEVIPGEEGAWGVVSRGGGPDAPVGAALVDFPVGEVELEAAVLKGEVTGWWCAQGVGGYETSGSC